MENPRVAAVILAAGKGTRLKSELPKVLHEICDRPMLAYVFDACRAAGVAHCISVVGHGRDLVKAAFADDADLTWVVQEPQLGTGHAVMVSRAAFQDYDHVLILCGDGPLIRAETIQQLLARHIEQGHAATLATAELDEPAGYGRIDRDADGRFRGIVEHHDCTAAQLQIREVNPSYYCFRVADLLPTLERLEPHPPKNEYYITDCLTDLLGQGRKLDTITAVRPEDIYSINSRRQLALVNDVMRRRILDRLMDEGVTVVDPATTWIDARATIGPDTTIHPFVHIRGAARIGRNCSVGPFAYLEGAIEVADGTAVDPGLGGGR